MWQPRQQAPPTDDSDVLFPSPPPELKCHVASAAIQWPLGSLDSAPCDASIETNCHSDWNCVKPSIATLQTIDISCTITETNIDSATLINDAENMNSMLALIRNGVKLRKTVTNDRSAPRLN